LAQVGALIYIYLKVPISVGALMRCSNSALMVL
jgi:hypothetical protein